MGILITVIHVVVCLALILIVLLQTGKGASIGASFGGGGSQTLFGGSGAATFLSKATTVIAIIFMLTSLTLAYMSGHASRDSIMTEIASPIEQPLPAEQSMPAGTAADNSKDGATETLPAEEGAQ
ncbi:MAG: preprotein translocase subunit SecG [Proteobacteria bacterium]|nr:preprotein translocase subunit SecG [Pseudomonadota bacterium]